MATSGAMMSVATSPGCRIPPPIEIVQLNGNGYGTKKSLGATNGSTVNRKRTWLSPIVATITITRGRSNRRRKSSSHSAPRHIERKRTKISDGPVLDVQIERQLEQEHRGDDPELALSEVEDAGRAVEQHEAQRQQPVEEAGHEALHDAEQS